MSRNNIPDKDRDRLRKLHAMMGSDNPGEVANAHEKIRELLGRYNATWSDLTELLHEEAGQRTADEKPAKTAFDYNPLDLIYHVLSEYVSLNDDQLVAATLWIAHTFVFENFYYTPRLFLRSPVAGCGKTTLLSLIERLVSVAILVDGSSDAVLFRLLDRRPKPTVLLDEYDNADLPNHPIARQVLNSGNRRGSKLRRVDKEGAVVEYSIFAPVAVAAIKRLHLPLMDRSIVISMVRSRRALSDMRADEDPALIKIRLATVEFFRANSTLLDPKPKVPAGFKNRFADNWRPLISVADLCGASQAHDWPALARNTGVNFSKTLRQEDPEILCIEHCLDAFKARNVDRLRTDDLLAHLHAMDSAPWSEWIGVKGNRPPHALTSHELAGLLTEFDIRPRVFNPRHRKHTDKSARGYLRSEFEDAWDRFGSAPLNEEDTAPAAAPVAPRRISSVASPGDREA